MPQYPIKTGGFGEPVIGEIMRGTNGESLGVYAGGGTVIQDTGSKSKLFDLPMGVKASESPALEQWRRVDIVAEFNPEVRSEMDRNGTIVGLSSIKPYFFEMPDKIGGAPPPPPHCGKCNRPVSRIRVVCDSLGASIEASCHGSNAGKFVYASTLVERGAYAIYLEMLEAFSNKGGFQKAEDYRDWKTKKFDDWKAIDDPRDKYKFDPERGRKAFEDVAKRAQEEIMKDDRWKIKDPKWKELSFDSEDIPEKYNPGTGMRVLRDIQEQELLRQLGGPIYSDTTSISTRYSPDCCLCKKPVRVTSQEDYSMRRHIVRFECHGRREEIIISDQELLYSGRCLGEFIVKASPFLSDFKRLNIPEEPPKQKPKTRTGLAITIGQERIINLE